LTLGKGAEQTKKAKAQTLVGFLHLNCRKYHGEIPEIILERKRDRENQKKQKEWWFCNKRREGGHWVKLSRATQCRWRGEGGSFQRGITPKIKRKKV